MRDLGWLYKILFIIIFLVVSMTCFDPFQKFQEGCFVVITGSFIILMIRLYRPGQAFFLEYGITD